MVSLISFGLIFMGLCFLIHSIGMSLGSQATPAVPPRRPRFMLVTVPSASRYDTGIWCRRPGGTWAYWAPRVDGTWGFTAPEVFGLGLGPH